MGFKDSLKYIGSEILRGMKEGLAEKVNTDEPTDSGMDKVLKTVIKAQATKNHIEKMDKQKARLDDAEIKYNINNDINEVIATFEDVLLNGQNDWNTIDYQIKLIHFYQKAGMRDKARGYMNKLSILPNLYDYRDISKIRYEQYKQLKCEKRYMYALKMLTISWFYSTVYLPNFASKLSDSQKQKFIREALPLLEQLNISECGLETLVDALAYSVENANVILENIYDEKIISNSFDEWERAMSSSQYKAPEIISNNISLSERVDINVKKMAEEKSAEFYEFLQQIKPIAMQQASNTTGEGFEEEMMGLEYKKLGDYQNAMYMFYISIYKRFGAPALYIESAKILRKFKLYDEERWVLNQGVNNSDVLERIQERLDKLETLRSSK